MLSIDDLSKIKEIISSVVDEKLDKRFGEFEVRMDEKLVALEARMDAKLVALEMRIDEKLVALEERMNEKFDMLDEKTGERIDRFGYLINIRFNDLEKKQDEVEDKISLLTKQVQMGN